MRKKAILILLVCVSLLMMAGCSLSLDSLGLGSLEEKLDGLLGSNPIICSVTAIDGHILTVEVLSPDGHYDEEDLLYLNCAAIEDISFLRPGNTITFTYDYVTGVTVKNDEPFILVTSLSPATYVPPVTEESTEA